MILGLLNALDFLSQQDLLLFLLALPLISMLYASVGHGGASGYLALMALFSFPSLMMKPTALLLNLFVAGISAYYFYKHGFLKPRLFFAFAVSSIPAAFLGGYLNVEPDLYKKILGVLLLFAVLRMLWKPKSDDQSVRDFNAPLALLIGLVIGFFSGLIGIGGGIILSPVLLLLKWADVKQTAAVSALFIWVNSLSGLSGLLISGTQLNTDLFILVAIAFLGGLVGARLGSGNRMPHHRLKQLLAVVLVIASVKLLLV